MDKKIIDDLKTCYGITCSHITPVTGGWLNEKWKVSSGDGDLLVKQYSNKRYSRDKLIKVESALQRQIVLEKNGVPCPFIRQHESRAIRLLDNETAYMVMDFHAGKMESPNTITTAQMRSLGSASALMHREFSKLPVLSVEGFPVDSEQLINSLWDNFYSRKQDSSSIGSLEYCKAVLNMEPILKQLSTEFFDKLPKGIAHEDYSPDNMLFDSDGLSVIIDFDRNHYSYILHDIGRAVLSLALKNDKLNIEMIYAFIEGYSRHSALAMPDIADALRLSWCIEVPWWIRPEFFAENREKPVRLKNEMLWITEHWFELGTLLA